MSKSTLVFGILIILSAVSQPAHADNGGPLSVSSCFSDILVDKQINTQNIDVRNAIHEQWSRDLYDEAKRSNTLAIWVNGVTAQDSYTSSDVHRMKEYFEKNSEFVQSSRISSYRARLNPQAQKIISDCLNAQIIKNGLGLYWIPYVHSDDPTLIDLEFRFQYQPATTRLHILTKHLDNAVVLTKGHPKSDTLFPPTDNVVIAYQNRSVRLKREKPGDKVTIVIETTPNLSIPPIEIEGESDPQICSFGEIRNDEHGNPLHAEVNDILIDEDKWLMKQGGRPIPEGNGASFKVSIPLDSQYPQGTDFEEASIYQVGCSRQGDPRDFFDWTYDKPGQCCLAAIAGRAEGLNGVCRGWWQNRGRRIKMTIDWQRFGYQCTSHEWKKEGDKWK